MYFNPDKMPTPSYVRDKDKLIKSLNNYYMEMFNYMVKALTLNPDNPQVIREAHIMQQMNFWLNELNTDLGNSLERLIQKTFLEGQAYHMLSIGSVATWADAVAQAKFNVVSRGKVEALFSDTYNDILQATNNTPISIKNIVRDTVQKVAQYNSLKNTNYTEQAEKLMKELSKKGLSEKISKEGFVGVIDRAGRRWDLRTYSNMVIKTKVNQAFMEGIRHEAEQTGLDLAIISDHGAKDACSKWEGVVISMNGLTEGYPTYEQARATNEIWHPNCEHNVHPIRSLDMLHPDDVKQAQKKAVKLGYKPPTVHDKPKTIPKAKTAPVPQEMPQRESLYELVKNTDSEIFKAIGEDNYNSLHTILKDAPEKQRQLWAKFETSLKVIDANSSKHPHNMGVNGIVMDVTKDGQGSSWSNPYQTTFHEFSHNIDYIANVKYGDGTPYFPLSYTYKDNLFGKTLQAEFDSRVSDMDKKMKALLKENKDNIRWLYYKGYITDEQRKYYRDNPEEFEKKKATIKHTKAMTYAKLTEEIRAMPLNERANLSDIMEGASKAKVNGGFGHGAKYWADRPHGLPVEAFAEMMDSSIANPKMFKVIEKYFPNSVQVFYEIIDHMLGGK